MKKSIIFLTLAFLFSFSLMAQQSTRLKHHNLGWGKLAIGGYDPVAYITQQNAVKGSSTHSYTYQGIKYYFSSASNKKKFIAAPSKYKPAYGGWCAYAMGNDGTKVSVNPKTFKVKNGKLYLFYNSWGTNTLNYWNKNESNLKAKADKNWSKTFR